MEEFRKYWPQGLDSKEDKDTYEWQRSKLSIDGLNRSCKNTATSYLKAEDDSMSEIRFRTTAKGDLTHLSYILHKPEPLRTEFKTVTCCVTGSLLLIEV